MTVDEFVALLAGFDRRREIVKAMRRALTREARPTIAKIREHAIATLPKRGGLNEWTAAARITPTIRYSGRSAGISLRGSRRSLRGKSQLGDMDATGLIRAPSWGHRGRNAWHSQVVPAEWFTGPAAADDAFPRAVDAEVERAKDQLR